MTFDQDLCLNLWYELNPRVRCAFDNVYQPCPNHIFWIFYGESNVKFCGSFSKIYIWSIGFDQINKCPLCKIADCWNNLVGRSTPICLHTAPHQVLPRAPVKFVCFTINEIPEREMGEIWEQICFFWWRGEPVIVEQIQARTTFAADGFRIWDLKLVMHKHCLKDLRLCTNTIQWRFKRHHEMVLFLSHFLLTHRLSEEFIASENKVTIKISQAISFLPLQLSVPLGK